jgi:GT2 family glycosyltransferase
MTTINPEPLVTINILSYNRRDQLRTTLTKIYGQEYSNIEVIVVDNNSEDGSGDMVEREFPLAILIRRKSNNGIGGWNDGFQIARGEYICVLDDDCHVEGRTIKTSIEKIRDGVADIISYHVVDPSTRYSFTLYFPFGIFLFWGCAVIMSKKVIDRLGGFDENIFLYQHESEYMLRAIKYGFRHQILMSEMAYHRKDPSAESASSYKEDLVFYGRSYSYLRHLQGWPYFRMLSNFIVEALIRYMRGIKKENSWKPAPFILLCKAIYKSHIASDRKIAFDGRMILDNDVNCINPLLRLFLRKISENAERDYLCRFYENRKEYYPDFVEKYFLRRIPFIETECP